MERLVLLLALSFSLCYASNRALVKQRYTELEGQYCEPGTVECRSSRELARIIADLEAKATPSFLDDIKNCTICFSQPCLNNGTCVPINFRSYRCDCTPQFGGYNCYQYLQCRPDSCGPNTDCFVANNQVNCVCKPGSAGDPYSYYGCGVQRKTAQIISDPNVYTFDGLHYDYLGTCPYEFVRTCSDRSFNGKPAFKLNVKERHVYDFRTDISEFEFTIYGQTIYYNMLVDYITFNGVRVYADFNYYSANGTINYDPDPEITTTPFASTTSSDFDPTSGPSHTTPYDVFSSTMFSDSWPTTEFDYNTASAVPRAAKFEDSSSTFYPFSTSNDPSVATPIHTTSREWTGTPSDTVPPPSTVDPSLPVLLISIRRYSNGIQVITHDHIDVFCYGTVLYTYVPMYDAYTGEKLCGTGGTMDDNWKNDLRYPNGTLFPVTSNYYYGNRDVYALIDQYIVHSFGVTAFNQSTCLPASMITSPNMTNCDQFAAEQLCQDLSDAQNGKGMFWQCQKMGSALISSLFQACVSDMCEDPRGQCADYKAFFDECQRLVPDVDLGYDWRQRVSGCSEMICGNGTYKSCASGCPATCQNQTEPLTCGKPCREGCICKAGYVFDPVSNTCIEPEDCGCLDSDGNPHPADEPWLSDNCTVSNECLDGFLHSRPSKCGNDAYCSMEFNELECLCDDGYEGDGYNCQDIDECLDDATCNHNATDSGNICTNLPGTYNCTCGVYYTGEHCENFVPRRDCADLFVYHNITDSGVYQILPPFILNGQPEHSPFTVYCEMEIDGGGWTLVSAANSTLFVNRTYAEYETGFGDPNEKEVWIGLEYLHQLSNFVETSLRFEIQRCDLTDTTYCTYSDFLVEGSNSSYRLVISKKCQGTAPDGYYPFKFGNPQFSNIDHADNGLMCSSYFMNTGFWFDGPTCGMANLNGARYNCDDKPDNIRDYIYYNGNNAINNAQMLVRPSSYGTVD